MSNGIFRDNDGVLMETEQIYYQANAEALAQAGVELTLEGFCRISLRQGERVLDLAAGVSVIFALELQDRADKDVYDGKVAKSTGRLDFMSEICRLIPGTRMTSGSTEKMVHPIHSIILVN